MGDNRTIIYCNFINRRSGQVISQVPIVNRVTLNRDVTQLADTFDFEVKFRFGEKIDLRSHDFVEFYFILNGQRYQIGCGFLEDFVRTTEPNALIFQANGRNFMGQFFNLPFLKAKPIDTTTILSFCQKIVDQDLLIGGDRSGTYLKEYCGFKRMPRTVVDLGSYVGAVNIPELSDSKIAPILQGITDEINNVVYQNRHGQLVIWGRGVNGANVDLNDMGLVLTDSANTNVLKFQLRENFSKVVSECKIMLVSGEGFLDYAATVSGVVQNTHPKAKQIFQPEIRTFQTGTLTNTAGGISPDKKRNMLAASIVRKSNQNLTKVVITTNRPYFLTADGQKIAYDVNQLWNVKSEEHGVDEKMRLSGIAYNQQADQLLVELCFIPKDSLC